MDGYCERHNRAFEIKKVPGGWTFECPQCRKEGYYNTYATTQIQTLPMDEWTVSDRVIENVGRKREN